MASNGEPDETNPFVAIFAAAKKEKTAARAAHRRYTADESRLLDETRWQLRTGGGIDMLLTYLNHRGDWATLWGGSLAKVKFFGDAYDPDYALGTQQELQLYTSEAIAGRQPFPGPIDIAITYRVGVDMSVETVPADDDMGQYLTWVLLEAIRTGDIQRLGVCRCGRFFIGRRATRKTCSVTCKRVAEDERAQKTKARNRRSQRRYADRHFGTREDARR